MELAYGINRKSVEDVFKQAQVRRNWHYKTRTEDPVAAAAVVLAKRRDSRVLRALDLGSEVLRSMSVDQFGARGLSVGGDSNLRVEASEYQTWRNALFLADIDPEARKKKTRQEQEEIVAYRWQILTAAWLAYGGPDQILAAVG